MSEIAIVVYDLAALLPLLRSMRVSLRGTEFERAMNVIIDSVEWIAIRYVAPEDEV